MGCLPRPGRCTIEEQIAELDVTTCWTGRGTHEGDLMGMQATWEQGDGDGDHDRPDRPWRLRRALELNLDMLGLLSQLGAVLSLAATA